MIYKKIDLSDDKKAFMRLTLHEAYGEKTLRNGAWYPEKRPLLLIVPGGSYAYCSEREADPVALHFLKEGWHTAILNYHVGKESAYPQPLKDLAAAMKHLRLHAGEYHIHPDKIALVGFSAGGHLSALLGSLFHRQEVLEQIGFTREEIRPNALLLGYPLVNPSEYTRALYVSKEKGNLGSILQQIPDAINPMCLIHDAFPPTFLFLTGEDEVISPIDTLLYGTELLKRGLRCEIHLYDRGKHGLSTGDDLSNFGRSIDRRFSQWVAQSVSWLKEIFNG